MKFANTHKVSTLAIAVAIALAAPLAWGQGQGPGGGGGGGGGKPPGGETAVNNLSYPAVKIGGSSASSFFNFASTVLGVNYSYGCAVEEVIGESKYLNTSCVSSDGLIYYTAETCRTLVPNCAGEGTSIDRIYWQKSAHTWSADALEHLYANGPRAANYVDWSDSLESQVWWDTASIRVETTPYADVASPLLLGVRMWHVFGQGTTELWGAHASDAGVADRYESTFAILQTDKARLNIAKLSTPVTDCSTSPKPAEGKWNESGTDYSWSGSLFNLRDIPYTVELNIQGKYVYGFNWQLRRDTVPPEFGKTGWWRLTFYTRNTDDSPTIVFPAADYTQTFPPGGAELTEAAFEPKVKYGLSYIDICVRGSKGGGGIKGGGKPQ